MSNVYIYIALMFEDSLSAGSPDPFTWKRRMCILIRRYATSRDDFYVSNTFIAWSGSALWSLKKLESRRAPLYVSHRPPPISELQGVGKWIFFCAFQRHLHPPKTNNENHTSSVKSGTTIINYLEKKTWIFTLSQGATDPWGTVFILNAEVPWKTPRSRGEVRIPHHHNRPQVQNHVDPVQNTTVSG